MMLVMVYCLCILMAWDKSGYANNVGKVILWCTMSLSTLLVYIALYIL